MAVEVDVLEADADVGEQRDLEGLAPAHEPGEALLRERHALRHVEGLQLGARALGQVREVPEALEAREAELALVGGFDIEPPTLTFQPHEQTL